MKKFNAKDMKIGTSSALFGHPDERAYDECAKAGIAYMEMRVKDAIEDDLSALAADWAQQKKWADDYQMGIWSLHLPYGQKWDISELHEEKRVTSLYRQEQMIQQAAKIMNIQKVVLHPSYEPIREDERPLKKEACRKSLVQLGQSALQNGVTLAVECLPRTCLCNTIAETKEILSGIGNIGLCCDMNHLMKDYAEDFIRTFGNRIVTTHFSDYDRVDERHWMPGKGVNNWNKIFEALSDCSYEGPAIFEIAVRANEKRATAAEIRACWDSLLDAYSAYC